MQDVGLQNRETLQEARRMIWLVDALYEHRVMSVFSAERVAMSVILLSWRINFPHGRPADIPSTCRARKLHASTCWRV